MDMIESAEQITDLFDECASLREENARLVAALALRMPESSCCQEDGDACGPFVDQEREIARLREALQRIVESEELTDANAALVASVLGNP